MVGTHGEYGVKARVGGFAETMAVCRLVRRIGMIKARWAASNAEAARSGRKGEIGIRLDETR